jgi:hypothetical protein
MSCQTFRNQIIAQIEAIPDEYLPELIGVLDVFVYKKENEQKSKLSYKERLAELQEVVNRIPPREDFDAYMKEFDECRKDRPLPFRD